MTVSPGERGQNSFVKKQYNVINVGKKNAVGYYEHIALS